MTFSEQLLRTPYHTISISLSYMHKTGDTQRQYWTDPNLSFCLWNMGRGTSPLWMSKDIKQNRLCA